jgi:hypothetical protein
VTTSIAIAMLIDELGAFLKRPRVQETPSAKSPSAKSPSAKSPSAGSPSAENPSAENPSAEISCYMVGDHVTFLRRRLDGDVWNPGTVTRAESWLRRDSTVGHRIEVSERRTTNGELRYGCWIFEDGDEATLRLDTHPAAGTGGKPRTPKEAL